MLGTIVFGAVALSAVSADPWDIKAPLAEKTAMSWALTVNADMGGETHEAKMTYSIKFAEKPADKPFKAVASWADLEVDGNAMGEETNWDITLNPRWAITGTTTEMGDDIRRMLSGITFVYPEKPVAPGDKWSYEFKPEKASKLNWDFEAKGVEKTKDVDTLKIISKVKETGDNAMSADGTWWVAKDGRVLKFEVKLKSWVVPMAGGQPLDATIKGEEKKK